MSDVRLIEGDKPDALVANIRHLVSKGRSEEQAVAEAVAFARGERLTGHVGLADMKPAELRNLARRYGIVFPFGVTKAEMVEQLSVR